MSVHQPVTIGHYTHCGNCLEAWPCHHIEADHASRRRLATTYVLPTGVEFLRRKLAGQDVAEQPVTVAALPLAEAK